jgi:hypothetical protein
VWVRNERINSNSHFLKAKKMGPRFSHLPGSYACRQKSRLDRVKVGEENALRIGIFA